MLKIVKEKEYNREFVYSEGSELKDDKIVKVKKMNHILSVVSLEKHFNGFSEYRKISKEKYCNITTGEIFYYDRSESRGDNIAGLKKTFRKLRDLINNNFVGNKNELHVILTYADNMQDTEKLYVDFKKFWQKFKRKFGSEFEYLDIVEPQGRGAWHHHLLLKSKKDINLYLDSNVIAKLWGNGFVKIRSLKDVDNIGAYLSGYLCDIEVSLDSLDGEIKEVDGEKKCFKKGGRLKLYPPGMNVYRKSRGIKFPEVMEMPFREVKKIVGLCEPTYSGKVEILVDGKKVNSVTYLNYNMKRK